VVDAVLLDLDETLIDGAGLAAGTLAACQELAVDFGTDPEQLAAEANAVSRASRGASRLLCCVL
jgi:heterodisulfide reductase subunit B